MLLYTGFAITRRAEMGRGGGGERRRFREVEKERDRGESEKGREGKREREGEREWDRETEREPYKQAARTDGGEVAMFRLRMFEVEVLPPEVTRL